MMKRNRLLLMAILMLPLLLIFSLELWADPSNKGSGI